MTRSAPCDGTFGSDGRGRTDTYIVRVRVRLHQEGLHTTYHGADMCRPFLLDRNCSRDREIGTMGRRLGILTPFVLLLMNVCDAFPMLSVSWQARSTSNKKHGLLMATPTTNSGTNDLLGSSAIPMDHYDIVKVDLEDGRDYPIYIGTGYSDQEGTLDTLVAAKEWVPPRRSTLVAHKSRRSLSHTHTLPRRCLTCTKKPPTCYSRTFTETRYSW